MFTGPGFTGGGRVRQLVSLVDFPPTLLDAAGIPQKQPMQGRSILPLLRGQTADWPREAFIQVSESKTARVIRTHRWKYEVTAPDARHGQPGAALYDESALYDMESDPYELENLIGQHAVRELCDGLAQRLVARMVEAGEAVPEIRPVSNPGRNQSSILPAELHA